ncbi:MAG: helix-turn-helix domain-containing protein [Clostridia bacterium]|nr:helix-turn-helix domain-containing protein [Clostridia bacterium]
MDNLYFGEIIRIRREELNMKQEELCEGVCERSTLSKIERGKNECSKYLAEVFLQRLGLPMDFYYASSSKTGIEQLNIRNKINDAIRMREYEKLPELIKKGENLQSDNIVFKQFLVETKAIHCLCVENNINEARNLLIEAIGILHKDFTLDKIERCHFIKEDIIILNALANTYCDEEDYSTAIRIFNSLLKSIERKSADNDDEETIRLIIMLKYNLSRVLGRADNYKECLIITDEAIELCKRHGRPTYLAELLINKGYALCSIHGRKEEGILVLKDALTLNRLVGFEDNVKTIYRRAKELFGIDLRKFKA